MQSPFTENIAIVTTASIALICCAFACSVYCILWVIPKATISIWYRISIGSLSLFFPLVVAIAVMSLFWVDLYVLRHTRIAWVLGAINVLVIYISEFSLGVSIFSCAVGVLFHIFNKR